MIEYVTMAAKNLNGISVFKPLYQLFGWAMEGLLWLFNDKYFLALIVFTILTRLVLFPINIKQQRTMAKTTRLQPKIQKIQKKYANSQDPRDRQKMNEEMQALYAREGHNPMNMGCGPMAFQMIFLMGIIGIIYYPLQYIIGIDIAENTEKIAEIINFDGQYFQIALLQSFEQYQEQLVEALPKVFTPEKVKAIIDYKKSMYLFGLDMTQIPSLKNISAVIIIPILCLVSSFASSIVSTLIQKKQNPAMAQQSSQMMLMMLMMPFFSFYISFKVSAAVGFYWIISNLVALVQQLVMAKFFPPKRNVARQMIEGTIERRSRENSIKQVK
ncbi:MAG: YidC/Oxa1 family membrane protein insertase [Eubacterium sp.]